MNNPPLNLFTKMNPIIVYMQKLFPYYAGRGWMSHVTRHRWLTNRVIKHIKEQIDNKWQVRKHLINLGHTPPNSGDTLRNQLTLIYWRYAPNIPPYKSKWHSKNSANIIIEDMRHIWPMNEIAHYQTL